MNKPFRPSPRTPCNRFWFKPSSDADQTPQESEVEMYSDFPAKIELKATDDAVKQDGCGC